MKQFGNQFVKVEWSGLLRCFAPRNDETVAKIITRSVPFYTLPFIFASINMS